MFVKSGVQRSTEADLLIEALGRKYASFSSLESLKISVRSAIADTIVLALRSFIPAGTSLTIADQLDRLAKAHAIVKVSPMIPDRPDSFHVQKVEAGNVVLEKATNQQVLEIPVSRISEILPVSGGELVTLAITGRIQWITAQQRWKFAHESVTQDSLYGLGKLSNPADSRIVEIRQRIGPLGFRDLCWDWKSNFSERLHYGWELFYDDDGKYLRYIVSPGEQLLFVQR